MFFSKNRPGEVKGLKSHTAPHPASQFHLGIGRNEGLKAWYHQVCLSVLRHPKTACALKIERRKNRRELPHPLVPVFPHNFWGKTYPPRNSDPGTSVGVEAGEMHSFWLSFTHSPRPPCYPRCLNFAKLKNYKVDRGAWRATVLEVPKELDTTEVT